VVAVPARKIWDKVLANLGRKVFASISVEALPVTKFLVGDEPEREENAATFSNFPSAGTTELVLNARACDAGLAKEDQQFVIRSNRLIDLLVDLLATSDILGSEPATDPLRLKVRVQSLGEWLVGRRVANETGIELDSLTEQGR
jgi:hypothetical protein